MHSAGGLWLKEVVGLDLPDRLPSYDTVRRTLGILNPVQFQSVVIKRIESQLKIPAETYISLNGKTLRSSGNKEAEIEPLHLLHAYGHESGVVIGQMECSRDKKKILF